MARRGAGSGSPGRRLGLFVSLHDLFRFTACEAGHKGIRKFFDLRDRKSFWKSLGLEITRKGRLVSDHLRKLEADKARRDVPDGRHKFAVGTFVSLIGRAEQATFKVTRQLPDGGSGLQYRIKNEREDYGRVATEALLNPVRR